ncbi:FecCD family ABC transporter permease [Cryptosporangium minutisporangium]|uniref:Iron chelate uptake ABC transporter family permease subunit n=1 Tax=Cryptosporangium minutisporangium TaxID=113569 RepID=A0ABP6TCR8_9ACTN
MRWAALVLVAAVIASVLLSLVVGSRSIGVGEVLRAVLSDSDSDNATVIRSQRVPRTILGVMAGAALGMAGALMQGHTRNPLADPGLFGVSAGASFGVAVLVFGLGVEEPGAQATAALVGAAAATVAVFLVGLRGLHSGALVMLAVVGTTLSALLVALTMAMILLDRRTLNVLRFFEVGSIANREDQVLLTVAPLLAVGAVLALVNGFALNQLGLGVEIARVLGARVRTARVLGILAITLLIGPATALCGPIVFVGLVAPHAARRITGHDYRWLIPLAGLIGAMLLLVADVVGRVCAPPGELEAGIVMAAIGAPVLIGLTRRRRVMAL